MNATTTANNSLVLAAATFGDDVKAFRSSSVTAENKGNVAAKSLLAALVSGVYTEALATAAIIHAFGNPKTPKGKPVETLSALRNFTGGDGVRKMADTVFAIHANIDTDKAAPEGNDDWSPVIRPLVVSFILGEDGAPKSLRALFDAVKAAIRSYAKLTQPDNSEAEEENKSDDDATTTTTTAPQSLTDRTLALMVAYEAASDDDKAEAYDALAALFELVNASIANASDDAEEEVAKAA